MSNYNRNPWTITINTIWGTSNPDLDMHGMMIDQDACDGAGDCISICPVNALKLVEGYVNNTLNSQTLFVNLDRCITCGVCEPVCPRYAIVMTSGGGAGPGGSGGGGNGGGGISNSNAVVAPVVPINLQKRLECFNTILDNANTQYKIILHAHRIDANSDKPGHAFITLEKSNGTQLQRLTYGFYPQSGIMSGTMLPVVSSIGEESGNTQRRSDVRYTLFITRQQFNTAIAKSISLAKSPYDLNDNNCTHYATDVFNAVDPPTGQIKNDGFYTPDGLYTTLYKLQNSSSGIQIGRINLPASTTCNN